MVQKLREPCGSMPSLAIKHQSSFAQMAQGLHVIHARDLRERVLQLTSESYLSGCDFKHEETKPRNAFDGYSMALSSFPQVGKWLCPQHAIPNHAVWCMVRCGPLASYSYVLWNGPYSSFHHVDHVEPRRVRRPFKQVGMCSTRAYSNV